MATEASAPPEVFARKATGLRREASALDIFIYNTNNQNVGIGVTFMVLLIPALYVGGSMVTATILAGLLALPMAGVYAYFAAAMPRSGGDYIYISRTLHPFLGFLSSWNWVIWLVTYTGIPAAYLAQYGLSGLCRELGYVFDSPTLVGYGDNFSRKWWIFVAGSLLLTFFAIVFALGTRLYFRIQNVTFVDRDERRRRRPRDPRRPQPDRHRERLQRLHLRRRRRRQRDGEPEQVLPEPSAEQLRPETDDVRDGVAALHHPLRHHVELHRRRGAKREALAVHRHAGLDRLRDDPHAVARARPEPRRRHDVPRPARLSAAAGRAERPRDRQPADLQRGDRHDGSGPGMARAAPGRELPLLDVRVASDQLPRGDAGDPGVGVRRPVPAQALRGERRATTPRSTRSRSCGCCRRSASTCTSIRSSTP